MSVETREDGNGRGRRYSVIAIRISNDLIRNGCNDDLPMDCNVLFYFAMVLSAAQLSWCDVRPRHANAGGLGP